jgi:hypothetical protein
MANRKESIIVPFCYFVIFVSFFSCKDLDCNKSVSHYKDSTPKVKDVILEDIGLPDKKTFLSFFNEFKRITKFSDFDNVKNISFDSLIVFDKVLPIKKFINTNFRKIFDDTLIQRMCDSTKIEYDRPKINTALIILSVRKKIKITNGIINVFQLRINKDEDNSKVKRIYTFDFFETSQGYKLYIVNSFRLLSF